MGSVFVGAYAALLFNIILKKPSVLVFCVSYIKNMTSSAAFLHFDWKARFKDLLQKMSLCR